MANTKITSRVIADDAVGADQLASNAVVTASMADDAVTQAKIANDAVGADQLASSAVVTASIVDDAVNADKLAANAVVTASIVDDAVTSAKLDTNIAVAGTLSVAGTGTFTGLVDAAIIDGVNFKVNGGQGSDGQVLTSTGSGVAWEASSGTTINNNADNSIITGSGTANTLEGEANLVFTGSNLGISVASPTVPLDIQSNSSASAIRIRGRSDDIAEVDFYNNANNSVMARFQVDTGYFATHVGGSERMRILDGGQLRIGTTSIITGSGEMISVVAPSQGMAIKTDNYCTMLWATGGGSTPTYCFFLSGSSSSTHQGSITKNGGGISYGSNSDYRLKENLDYTWDATTRLKQLKPVRFNWIADETNTLIDGFIAHEVQSVVPEAVTGIKDATHTAEEANESIIVDEGDIKAQQMDASKLIPLLVKAMQEQQALIEAQATTITDLTARITALES